MVDFEHCDCEFPPHPEPATWTGRTLLEESGYWESDQRHSHPTREWS